MSAPSLRCHRRFLPIKRPSNNSWGPGKYDPRYNQDGKSTPLVLPPPYRLADSRRRLRGPHGQQGVPDDASPRTMAASAVLP